MTRPRPWSTDADEVADNHEAAFPDHIAQVSRLNPNGEGKVEVYCLHCDFSKWARP